MAIARTSFLTRTDGMRRVRGEVVGCTRAAEQRIELICDAHPSVEDA